MPSNITSFDKFRFIKKDILMRFEIADKNKVNKKTYYSFSSTLFVYICIDKSCLTEIHRISQNL